MTDHPIPDEVALELRQMLEVTFRNLRRAENALVQHPSPRTRQILDALSRAERELGIANSHLQQIVPDSVLFASSEPWLKRVRNSLWRRK
ncbi:MAG: hypothetical protein HOP24_05490 [Sideroxydans sp.]|nr:hypothetical protein [Sideroxydans sp.]